ncbi:MAG TPA: hypothetical protein VFY79_06020, partial [Dehalococcoidia bacterium]|nr:hypothetical protein [Dehalococcoidia bacterium]
MNLHRRSATIIAIVLASSLLAAACGSPKGAAHATRTSGADASPTPVPTRPPGVAPTPFPSVEAKVVGSTEQDPGITAIAASGDHVWLAVNDAMLESDDRGGHWRELAPPPAGIDSLSFVSGTEGWAGNPGGLFHTTDGGGTWIEAGAGPVKRVRFVDAQHGWVAGNGRFLRTTDRGAAWEDVEVPCAGRFGSAFAFYSSAGGWYVCAGEPSAGAQGKQLFRTADGGVTWALFSHADFAEPPTTPSAYPLPGWGYLQDLFALDSAHLWMSVERGGVIASTDGAHSWNPLTFDARGAPRSDGAWFVTPS